MADDAAPPTDAAISTPYLVRQQDGSTQTYYLHTDRPPTQGEVAQYAESQGHNFAGFPQPAAEAAAPSPAPAPEAPGLASRAYNLLLPARSFVSQLPSMGGAVGGGMYGAALGAPFGPPGMIVGGLIGAGIGGAGGEAAQYGGEKLLGAAPAEEGTLGQRVASGGLRGVVGEVFGAPVRALGLVPAAAVRPVARAAGELAPVLRGTAEAVGPAVAEGADELTAQVARVIGGAAAPHGAAEQLAAQAAQAPNRLTQWWAQNAAGRSGAEIAKAWALEGAKGQAAIAGEHLGNMQTIMGTLERGGVPLQRTFDALGLGSAGGSLTSYLTGHPALAGVGAIIPAKELAANVGNKLVSGLLATPEGMQALYGLSRGADVAAPWLGGLTRAVAQPPLASQWPPAGVMWPTQPPP